MKITRVELLRAKDPVTLPEPWKSAWTGPLAEPITEFWFSCYKVYTDEGIIGYGPDTRMRDPSILKNYDPFEVGRFWNRYMGGKRAGNSQANAAGAEIAMWDIIGKAAGLPVYKLLGACSDRQPVYAATSRLKSKEWHVEHVLALMEEGFKAVKLRLHRLDPAEDLEVIKAVRKAAGPDLKILVDANQNNAADGYPFWSKPTVFRMARELDALDVFYLEDPLPRTDIEGLAELAASVDMFISGGEHTPTYYDFREHIVQGAYDIIQPDVVIGGNWGITGLRKAAETAGYFTRQIVPHVMSGIAFSLGFPATLQAMATVENCPLVEYPYDPPILVPETNQAFVREPLRINAEGEVELPDKPGIGVEIDEDKLLSETLVE
jgi:L-alanine-DL-glutamate epimerase-like enolase superfamily enzyme